MMPSPPAPLILTLMLDERSFGVLNELRRQHFPPDRNVVPAHITLFHALPGEQENMIKTTLRMRCSATPALPIVFPAVRSLGRGVAIDVACPGLVTLRQHLATAWSGLLSAQDRQTYRPHVTIQNKVTPAEARRLYDQLSTTWSRLDGQGEGLAVWRYVGGPWEAVDQFVFSANSPAF